MDALTAKLGKLSKPQIILTAAGAGIAMAIAYRLADRQPELRSILEITIERDHNLVPRPAGGKGHV